jgi:hypothetical protein
MKGFGEINEGFHSYISKKELLKSYKWINLEETVIISCIIPKGSQYAIGRNSINGEDNNIVSNNIILPKTFTYKDITYYLNKKGELKTKPARKR